MYVANTEKKITTSEVLMELAPGAGYAWGGDEYEWSGLEWEETNSAPKPTEEEFEAKVVEMIAKLDAEAYARNRKLEYDALNQFELMTDDSINSTTTHKDAIVAIKTKWPKDNSGPV